MLLAPPRWRQIRRSVAQFVAAGLSVVCRRQEQGRGREELLENGGEEKGIPRAVCRHLYDVVCFQYTQEKQQKPNNSSSRVLEFFAV